MFAKTLSYKQIPEDSGTFSTQRGVVQEVDDVHNAGARGAQLYLDPEDEVKCFSFFSCLSVCYKIHPTWVTWWDWTAWWSTQPT